jgi:hypothetical protein
LPSRHYDGEINTREKCLNATLFLSLKGGENKVGNKNNKLEKNLNTFDLKIYILCSGLFLMQFN